MLLLLYFFISALVFGCFKSVSSQNTVYGIFYLVFSFCAAAGIFILFELEFISLLVIIIYVGAIAVLFLFVIMMLNVQNQTIKKQNINTVYILFLAFIFFAINVLMFNIASPTLFLFGAQQNSSYAFYNNYNWVAIFDKNLSIVLVGKTLFSYIAISFLLAGLLLLAGILVAVVLTMNVNKKKAVQQKIYYQFSRSANNAIFKLKK